jgi:hypothetical protein
LEDSYLPNGDCDITYQITPEAEAVVDFLEFFAFEGEDRWPIGPDEHGLVAAPPGAGLAVEAFTQLKPDDAVVIPGLWGMTCDSSADPGFELHKNVWPDEKNIFDFDPVDNEMGVFVPLVMAPLSVEIDIKPGSKKNPINLKSNGVVPVAVLTTDTFDAISVDPKSVNFAKGELAHKRAGHLEDVDRDGDVDLVLHFKTKSLEIDPKDGKACLWARTWDGTVIEGCVLIQIVKGK